MNAIASPSSTRPRFARAVGFLTVLALLGGLVGAYQVGVRAKRPPSFTVGGDFVNADAFPTPGVDGRGYPYGNVLQSAPVGAAAPDDDHTPTPIPAASGSTAAPSPAAGGVPAAVVDLLTRPRP